MQLKDHTLYQHLSSFQEANKWELMRRYGAHGIGVAWKKTAGEKTSRPSLTFYVQSKVDNPKNPIPKTFSYLPEGQSDAVELPTDVVEAPEAVRET